MNSEIHWARIVGGAILLELALAVVLVPPMMVLEPTAVVPFVPIGTLVLGFLVTRWILRKVPSRRVLHGALIGIIATAIYFLPGLVTPGGMGPVIEMYGPFLFVLANSLRIGGCIAGGITRSAGSKEFSST